MQKLIIIIKTKKEKQRETRITMLKYIGNYKTAL
jgi:hypothetical protein